MYRVTRTAVVVGIVFLLSLHGVFALTVTPQVHQITDPTEDVYSFVYSVVNNDPRPRSLSIRLEPFSMYLEDKVTFSKQQFTLMPEQTENIQLSIHPSGLGPETHTLRAGVYDGEEKLATMELLITVNGNPVENYAVTLDARDASSSSAVPLSIELSNYGNIIGYAQLTLDIERGGEQIGSITYPELVQVLPGAKVSYDLVYTEALQPGFYTARITAAYPSQSVTATDQFSVQLKASTQRLTPGSDLVLTFASLGHPAAITYSLLDSKGSEKAAGTFLPQSGDILIPTGQLSQGTYELFLRMPQGEQQITVVIKEDIPYMMYLALVTAVLITAYALYTNLPLLRRRWRLYHLQRAVEHRQEVVINLINRSHRLVDEYTAYARRRQAGGASGAPNKGS
jgi:hypothetical protein